MKSGMFIVKDKVKRLQDSIGAMVQNKVLVGVPAEKAERDDEDGKQQVNNATIGYWMENGVPEHNIPARPHLIPGVREAEEPISEEMRSATISALTGDKAGFMQNLRRAGQIATTSVQNKIDTGPFKALADSTLRARARKQAVSGGTKADREAARKALETGDYSGVNAKPLIDTAQYLRAQTYVIRKS